MTYTKQDFIEDVETLSYGMKDAEIVLKRIIEHVWLMTDEMNVLKKEIGLYKKVK